MTQPEPQADVATFVRSCLSDTGYLCRNLLGYNYDEHNGIRTNVGKGGILPFGANQQIVEFLDNPLTRYKHLQAPRGSRKSTIAQGYIIRRILLNPDIRVAYVSKTDKITQEKAFAIRNALESELVRQFFGEQQGQPWEDVRFTVRGRKNTSLQNPTFSTFSLESLPTGGRFDLIVIDDLIDQDNCTNKEQLEKVRRVWAMIQPFLAAGGTLLVIGTRYHPDDIYADIEKSPLFTPQNGGEILILGAGVKIVRDKQGRLDLEVLPEGLTFPHLTLDFLREKLHGMAANGDLFAFTCQYLNEIITGATGLFRRFMFRPLEWDRDMESLTGYLLTDTAVSQKDEGCHSVVAYVGLDASDNIYLLDLRVGHFQPHEFVNVFFDVLESWSQKVNHAGEVWEDIALSTVYQGWLDQDARSRKIRLRPIAISRYSGERKHMRIQRLHSPLYEKRFFVVNTVPATFDDLDGTKPLWNPIGHYNAKTKTMEPAGELVDQFVGFPTHSKNDIADTIAMILEHEKHKGHLRRYCTYRPYNRRQRRPDVPADRLTADRTAGYGLRNRVRPSNDADSWWDSVIRQNSPYG